MHRSWNILEHPITTVLPSNDHDKNHHHNGNNDGDDEHGNDDKHDTVTYEKQNDDDNRSNKAQCEGEGGWKLEDEQLKAY